MHSDGSDLDNSSDFLERGEDTEVAARAEPSRPIILLVEDDVAARRALSKALERSGYTLCCAATTSAARKLLTRFCPGVVILSLGVRDEDALQLAARINIRANLRVIVCSARHAAISETLRGQTSVSAWLTRPFDPDELEERIAFQIHELTAA